MTEMAPALLVATAGAFVGFAEEGGNNKGQVVERMLRDVSQLPGQPWCAAFVHHVGYWSQYQHATGTSSWPLPPTASCYELGEYARRNGALVDYPCGGDVFLLWSAGLKRFAHTGVIVSVDRSATGEFFCTTIEGNTDAGGSREGDAVMLKRRSFVPARGDRFIRWLRLIHRNAA